MSKLGSLEGKLRKLDKEVTSAHSVADSRIGGVRRVKLGDLNFRDNLYIEMKPLFRELYNSHSLRRTFFGSDHQGLKSRRLLLVFMSELVYWEYERSFWRKLYESLELDDNTYRWFTTQMEEGYKENHIPLIRSKHGSHERKEYVRTIISESGFSRQLVNQAKCFVIWFFDNHANLDPRLLDTNSFEKILDESGFNWDKTEIFDLLRDMVGAVSRLLREIRKRSLTSVDLQDETVLNVLEEALGFHPVKGIFGFRRQEDIQELLEQLASRVKPDVFHTMLRLKLRSTRTKLWVRSPNPEQSLIEVNKANDVYPVYYGEYSLLTPRQSEIQVVPREALTLSKLAELLKKPQRTFHQDSLDYAYIHNNKPFEVYQGNIEPEESRPYHISGLSGYLWYGKQKVGIPLRAEREGNLLAELGPRTDVRLNPRLRLNRDGDGMQVVIPSFICYEPNFAGQTVRLELNGRPIENTTYVVGHNGFLQFQSTRVAEVLPQDQQLKVELVAVNGKEIIRTSTVFSSLERDFLFSKSSRELVHPGYQLYGSDRFVLFTTEKISEDDIGKAIDIEASGVFGHFQVFHLRWKPTKHSHPFELKTGSSYWEFAQPLEIYATLFCTPTKGPFYPEEYNAAFAASDIQIRLFIRGAPDKVAEISNKITLIIEKDDEFLTDFSLVELERMKAMHSGGNPDEYPLNVSRIIEYLIGQRLIDREVGTYRWSLMFHPQPLADLELLSEIEFMLLPTLEVEDTDALMNEGEECLLTVLSNASLLAGTDDSPTDILQITCKPEAILDAISGEIQSRFVERTIRLTYPPTKVKLRFKPQLFATRLVHRHRVLHGNRITHEEAKEGYIAVTAPSDKTVQITCLDWKDEIWVNDKEQGRYPLVNLLSNIKQDKTAIHVVCENATKQYQIDWHVSLHLDHEQSFFRRKSDEAGEIVLVLNVKGPPTSQIHFKFADNKLRSHGRHVYTIADLSSGLLELPIELQQLQDANLLFCTVFAKDNKLDSTRFVLDHTSPEEAKRELADELHGIVDNLEQASLQELVKRANFLEDLGESSLAQQIREHMYSCQRLDQIYQQRDSIEQQLITAYFERVQFLESEISIPKLKQYSTIPDPKLRAICAERLIMHGDGIGVETVIDLILQEQISLEHGVEILSKNEACTSEIIYEIAEWDALEQEQDNYIVVLEQLSQLFQPDMIPHIKAVKDWKRASILFRNQDIIEARIIKSNPNGLIIPFGLISGLVPIEEIDTQHHGLKNSRQFIRKKLPKLVGQTIPVLAVEVNRREKQLIFSEKKARQQLKQAFWDSIKEGETVTGIVTGLHDFGVFVDLGVMDGLIHTSELTWEKSGHLREKLSIGDEVTVYVLSIDQKRERVTLSLKRLEPDPWLEKARKYKIGELVQGVVRNITDFEVFVSVNDEMEGFVHISELSQERINHPNEVVHLGKKVNLRVLRIDEEKRRLILSLKQVGLDDLYWGRIRVKPS